MSLRILLVVLLALVGAGLPFVPIVRELEEHSIDARFLLRSPRPSDAPVIVVAVDDRTERVWREERKLPKVAWPGEFARILEVVGSGGAKQIAFDFEFPFDIDDYLTMKGVDETPFFSFVDAVGAYRDRCVIGSANPDEIAAQLAAAEPRIASVNRVRGDQGVVRRVPRVDSWYRDKTLGLAFSMVEPSGSRTDAIDINYTGSPIRTVSAIDVAEGTVPPETFRGAYVLVGETYASSPDQHRTPFAARVPGVFVHAEALRTLLDGTELTVLGSGWSASIGALVAILAALLAFKVWPFIYACVAIPFGALWSIVSLKAFESADLVIPYIPAMLMVLFLAPATVYAARTIEESRKRSLIKAQWGQMVSDRFVERMLADHKKGLGSWEHLEACILFLDIADFSAHSNTEEQEGVVDKLNLLFPAAIERVRATHGEVLNFMGDGLSAIWEVGPNDEREARLKAALTTALEILADIDRLNANETFGDEPWNVRIGLAYGEVTLALVGTKDRKQMTLYGPAVNLAARCEQAGKSLVPDAVPPVTSRLIVTDDFASPAKSGHARFERIEYRAKGWPTTLSLHYLVEK